MTQPVIEQLLDLASSKFQRDRTGLRADDDIFETLGIDSVDAMDWLSSLEQKFAVEVPDYEVQDVRTFADLARAISSRLV